ncbi:Ger(X)C family germination protein [Bacillus cereus BAG1X2-3]|uniref:Ger(X)C family spore germination protein n=2 Tax=Bacillus cereus group TaxID=86661 RepID=A0A9X7AR06_BACTU|nr:MULTISPECIES: Ger(x)C family spore germination protein [Bacillus]AKR07912.1 spore gernimation protein GerYC [Bacillus thuringiensis]EOO25604.1 Ger(X)C family germination protein [Bacillus cereus BAG1X1-1]EOO48379.1 Ger(X)C family germination protein [Bacillus cereus BAG1X2-2]EOO52973.1 Ger(X)C family germination protein [Bacillus cereus BAG1X2-1]EOO61674.1 Ger(X)C family germination protein [Bacillus cereus BAG1X2-3]
MKNILLCSAIIVLIFQSGCTQANIVDTQRIIHVGGFDITKDKQFRGTILYPDYTKGVQSKPQTQSTTAGTIETISSRLNAKSPHTIAVGQMRVVLFGKAFGEHGIGDIINNLQRDPNIGRDVQLALVDGSTEKLLKHVKTNGSLYLSDLLEQNIENETIPRTALNIFLYNFYSSGCDPFLPYIKVDEDQSASIKGLAFLKKDKVVMYTDKKGSFLLKLLINPTKNGRYEVPIRQGKHKGLIATQNLSGNSICSLSDTGNIPKIHIHLKLNGLIKNAPPWLDLSKTENVKYVKKHVEKTIENHLNELIKQFQEKEVDPIGIREEIRSHSRKWTMKQIQDMYPNVDVAVHVQINVVQSGIGE